VGRVSDEPGHARAQLPQLDKLPHPLRC
jgi:hypothetical protein